MIPVTEISATMKTPYNPISGTVYQGSNITTLLTANGKCLEWATFLQWTEAGYKVKKGSKGTTIRTFAEGTKVVNGKSENVTIPRFYTLFSKDQVTNE